MILSGNDSEAPRHSGVGFIITPSVQDSIMSSQLYSNRLASLKLKAKHGCFDILSAYVPHNGHDVNLRRDFFSFLLDKVQSLSVNGSKLIYGDLNSILYSRSALEHEVIGPHLFGDDTISFNADNNRQLLVEVCNALDLYIANTFFEHPPDSTVTFWAIGGKPFAPISVRSFA